MSSRVRVSRDGQHYRVTGSNDPQLNIENVIYVNYFRSYKDKTCLLNIFYGHIWFNYQFSQLNPYQWVFERTQVQISSVTTFHHLNTLAAKIAAKIASVNGTWEFTFLSFSVANTTRTLKAGRETARQIPSSKQFSINQLNLKLPDMFWKVRGSFQTCSLSLQVRASTLFTNTKENGITNPAFSAIQSESLSIINATWRCRGTTQYKEVYYRLRTKYLSRNILTWINSSKKWWS